jgi:hypothetical protein
MRWKRAAGAVLASATMVTATLAGTSAVAAPAGTGVQRVDHRPCITFGEYRQLHDGLRLRRVKRIIDAPGKITDLAAGTQTRRWFACLGDRRSKVWVDFYHARRTWREFDKRKNFP